MSGRRGLDDAGAAGAPTVLLTGAAAGIGRATALRLARDGWRCWLVDADADGLARLAADWPADASAPQTRVVDLTDPARIDALGAELPALDALINNAGMSAGGAAALAGLGQGEDEADAAAVSARLMALNLDAPARMVLACAGHLREGARIVNVASGAGLRAIGWRGLYSPSKAGVIAMTEALARQRPGWTVTALAPGFVRTELVQRLIGLGRIDPARAVARIPLGRMAEGQDMADALAFLASPGAAVLSGQTLVVDGGSSVCGGSEALPGARHAPLPADAALALRLRGFDAAPDWFDALGADAMDTGAAGAYPAVIDASTLAAPPGGRLQAARRAARSFADALDRDRERSGPCSLTLLLPAPSDGTPWPQAGDLAATHMLVATLAAEWGARGWRINAVQAVDGRHAAACVPLLRHLAGARAQFITGQVLRPGAR